MIGFLHPIPGNFPIFLTKYNLLPPKSTHKQVGSDQILESDPSCFSMILNRSIPRFGELSVRF